MKIIEDVKRALENYTAYELAKVVGVSSQSLQKYKNKEAEVENMRLGTALQIVKFLEEKENTVMKKEDLLKLIKEELASMDEEIRDNLYDVYFQPSDNHIWLMDAGMEYSGDDRDAYYVAQIENQEVVSWA